jgi:hypothetical protein
LIRFTFTCPNPFSLAIALSYEIATFRSNAGVWGRPIETNATKRDGISIAMEKKATENLINYAARIALAASFVHYSRVAISRIRR